MPDTTQLEQQLSSGRFKSLTACFQIHLTAALDEVSPPCLCVLVVLFSFFLLQVLMHGPSPCSILLLPAFGETG